MIENLQQPGEAAAQVDDV